MDRPLVKQARDVPYTLAEPDDVASLATLKTEAGSIFSGTAVGASTIASRIRYVEPSETQIFFDWDDTLFPSTHLFDRWRLPSRPERWADMQLTEAQNLELQRWQQALFQYLKKACSLSASVVIMTNSRRPWVDQCVRQFAPDVVSLLEHEGGEVRVVYAHEHLVRSLAYRPQRYSNFDSERTQEEHDEQQTKAKFVAMRKEVRTFYSRYPGQTWKNIISIGDMRYEHDALQEVTFQRDSPLRERLRTKTIVVREGPSVSLLSAAFDIWIFLLPACVYFDGNIDMDFSKSGDRAKTIADALGMNVEECPDVNFQLRMASSGDTFPYSEDNEDFSDSIDQSAMFLHDVTYNSG